MSPLMVDIVRILVIVVGVVAMILLVHLAVTA